MDTEKLIKIESAIKNLDEKKAKIFFLVQDTKGNPRAGVRHIYEMAYTLHKNGFNVIIIHETKEYEGVAKWLGEEYMSLPHQTIEGQNLAISPEDFIVVPELYGHVMEQLKNFNCGKIVLCQAYDYMLETIPPGVSWTQFGFVKCITTSEKQKNYITQIMKTANVDVIEPFIPSCFSKKDKPSKPIIAIHTREQRDTAKIIKSFYLKFPQYRWITFRDMRGIKQEDFSKFLKESFVSVWVDNESGFGTFPIESMLCSTPVIGKIPNMKPDWLKEDNGIWTYEFNDIVDILANFTQNWLEDNISESLYEKIVESGKEFSNYEKFEKEMVNNFNSYFEIRSNMFSSQLEKINVTE
jgi:hypothetical protein